MRRERQKLWKSLQLDAEQDSRDIEAIYFDSRKEQTLKKIGTASHQSTTFVNEEHYVLVSEPGNVFLKQITPISGKAKDVSAAISNFFDEKNIANSLKVIGTDGAKTNTGNKGGVIRLLEKSISKPVHWII